MSITESSFREMIQYRSHIQCFRPFNNQILRLDKYVLSRLLIHVSMLGIYFLCSFIFWMQIHVSNLKIPETNSLPLWVKSFFSSLFHVCCMYAGLNSAAQWIFLQACWMNRSDQQWTRNYLHNISCLVCLTWFLESFTCKLDFLFTSVLHWIKARG